MMVMSASGPPTREASVLAAYKLLSEDASIIMNLYRRLKLSYYQYEVSSVCYMLQWWEKLLVNLTVLGVVLLVLYAAFNQAVKIPSILSSLVL